MKKLLLASTAMFLLGIAGANAQSGVIQGQVSPGVYAPVTVNGGTPSTPLDVNVVGASSGGSGNNAVNVPVVSTGVGNQNSFGMLYDGVGNWNRAVRNVVSTPLTTSSAGTGTVNGSDQVNYNGRGAICVVNVSASTGTISAVYTIQGKDVSSGTYYNLLSGIAIIANGSQVLTIYPGITPVTNVSINMPLPERFRISVTIGGTTPTVTSTVGCSIIL